MPYVKYTFFEIACDNGVLVSEFRKIVPPHIKMDIVPVNHSFEREVRLYRNGEESPCFVFLVPMRTTTESQSTYHDRLRFDIRSAWDEFAQTFYPQKKENVQTVASPDPSPVPETESAGAPALDPVSPKKKGKGK